MPAVVADQSGIPKFHDRVELKVLHTSVYSLFLVAGELPLFVHVLYPTTLSDPKSGWLSVRWQFPSGRDYYDETWD